MVPLAEGLVELMDEDRDDAAGFCDFLRVRALSGSNNRNFHVSAVALRLGSRSGVHFAQRASAAPVQRSGDALSSACLAGACAWALMCDAPSLTVPPAPARLPAAVL